MAPLTRPGPSHSVRGIVRLVVLIGMVVGVIGLETLVQGPAYAGSAPHTASSPTAACVSPSGECMPVGDIPGWHQIFTDDFSTDVPLGGFSGCQAHNNTILDYHCTGLPASVDAKWAAYPDGNPDTTGHGERYPSKVVSINNGVLDFNLHNENGVNMDAVLGAKLPGSTAKGGLLGGRYVVRFRADSVYGYKFAWELWPDSGNNFVDGEIEFPSGNLNSTVKAFMHPMNFQGNFALQSAYHSTASYTAWHTATIDWLPQQEDLKFYLDGVLMGENTGPSVPSTPMHWLLQNETSSDGTIPGPTDAGHIQVDWVAVYAPTNVPSGYQEVASDGGLFSYGAPFYGSMGGQHLNAPIVGMASDPSTGGYWEVASDGGIFAFNAPFAGSMGGQHLNSPIVGIATDPATGGYWEVAADGGIFAYNAPFYGSMGGQHLNAPIVGISATPDGLGYRLVASDGGLFSFGAPFSGSMGGQHLNSPIVGIATDASTGGYWEVASDGGIFAFNAPFAGSMGGQHLNSPIVGIATDKDTGGYWELASDGGIFAFNAPFDGSMGGQHLNSPIVGIS